MASQTITKVFGNYFRVEVVGGVNGDIHGITECD